MSGHRLSDVVHDGINLDDIKPLIYPSDDEINSVGVTGLFLGYFEKWDSKRNSDFCLSHGWSKNPDGVIEGAYNDIENLDCKWVRLHDYMKFIKYGFGRATDQICIEIRSGRMTRDEGIEALKNTKEGRLPVKYLNEFLSYLDIDYEEYNNILDSFTNKLLFSRDEEGHLLKDDEDNLIKKYYPS
jgi:hypothetical protein